jgi:hypothetical protein
MKQIVFAFILGFSTVASAFVDVPTQFPTESGWGKYVISKACDVKLSSLKDASILVSEQGQKTVYVAIINGEVVAEAAALGDYIWSTVQCSSVLK